MSETARTIPFLNTQEVKDLAWHIKEALPNSTKVNQVLEAIAKHYKFKSQKEMFTEIEFWPIAYMDNGTEIRKLLEFYQGLKPEDNEYYYFSIYDEDQGLFVALDKLTIVKTANGRKHNYGFVPEAASLSIKCDSYNDAYEVVKDLNSFIGVGEDFLKISPFADPYKIGLKPSLKAIDSPFDNYQLWDLCLNHGGTSGSVAMSSFVAHMYSGGTAEVSLSSMKHSLDGKNWKLAMRLLEHYHDYGENDKIFLELGSNIVRQKQFGDAYQKGRDFGEAQIRQGVSTEEEMHEQVLKHHIYLDDEGFVSPAGRAFDVGAKYSLRWNKPDDAYLKLVKPAHPMQKAIDAIPDLTFDGVGPFIPEEGLTVEERSTAVRSGRLDLKAHRATFEKVMKWLEQIEKRKSINNGHTSYGLKHIAEDAIGEYVSNGVFIAAAICSGFDFKLIPNSLNVKFNISEKSLKPFIDSQSSS